jgi:hypothetical protein
MKIRIFIILMCLSLFSGPAFAVTDHQCMSSCATGGGGAVDCREQCTRPDSATDASAGASGHAENLKKAQERKAKDLDLDQKKLEVKQESFACIAACQKAGNNSDEYCEQSCATPAAQ